MYTIEKTQEIADKIFEIQVNAPHVARNAKAGQFVIIRTDDTGERIPLTISRVKGDLVRIIFMTVGKTTHALAAIKKGESIADIAGPLGKPSEIKKWGTCVIVGGGAVLWGLDWLHWQATFLVLAVLVFLNSFPVLYYREPLHSTPSVDDPQVQYCLFARAF